MTQDEAPGQVKWPCLEQNPHVPCEKCDLMLCPLLDRAGRQDRDPDLGSAQ